MARSRALLHLIQRGGTWYVRRRVPKDAQYALGREVWRTTGTTSLEAAKRRRDQINAEIGASIEHARKSKDAGSPDWVMAQAKSMLKDVRDGRMDLNTLDEMGWELLLDGLQKARNLKNDPETGNPVIPDEATDASIGSAFALLDAGPDAFPLSDAIEEYLTERKPHIAPQTYLGKERALGAVSKFLRDPMISAVTRRDAGRYVSHLLSLGRSSKTTRDELSVLSTFWKWALRRGHTQANVFDGMSADLRTSRRGGGNGSMPRRAWTEDELKAMLQGLDRDKPMHDKLYALTAIGAYTGARLDELCSLKVSDVQENRLCIRAGKTAAAVREVPIHPVLSKLVRKLKDSSTDGYLIDGLSKQGQNERRAHYPSKRFGQIKRRLGVCDLIETERPDGSKRAWDQIDFHALRRTMNTAMMRAGVPQGTREAIVGHAPTGGVNVERYLDPAQFAELKKAVRKVSYGAVDEIVRKS